MRIIAVLALTLLGAIGARAQADPAPPAPLEAFAPATEPAPAAEDGQGAEDSDEEETDDDEPGSLWGPLFAGGGACLGLDVVGGGLSALGCIFTQVAPDASSGDNCAEACVIGVISAGIVVLGLILATAGMIVLGPLAALVVTGAVTVSSLISGRAFWGAALGGLPGIALGIGGVVLAGFGLSDMEVGSGGGLEPGLFSGAPSSTLALAGFGMVAAAGVTALVGALAGDMLLTSPSEENEPPPKAARSRLPLGDELPLALAGGRRSVAY